MCMCMCMCNMNALRDEPRRRRAEQSRTRPAPRRSSARCAQRGTARAPRPRALAHLLQAASGSRAAATRSAPATRRHNLPLA